MNKQEIFNTVYIGLMKQGKKAIFNGTCVYRTYDGLKCAAGMLMSDDEVANLKAVNGANPNIIGVGGLLNLPRHIGENIGFVGQLQHIHDGYEVDEWPNLFKNLANQHNLTVPEIPA